MSDLWMQEFSRTARERELRELRAGQAAAAAAAEAKRAAAAAGPEPLTLGHALLADARAHRADAGEASTNMALPFGLRRTH